MCDTTTDRIQKAWQVFGMIVTAAVFTIVITFFLAPHHVSSYYLNADVNNGMATCVWADTTWGPDMKCYCTNNPQQAIEDLKILNTNVK